MNHSNLGSSDSDLTAQQRALSEPIEAVIDEIQKSVDVVRAITVIHPLLKEEMDSMRIIVHTDDQTTPIFDPMQRVTLTEAVIEIEDGEQVGMVYDIYIMRDDPAVTETVNTTPVYRSDNVENGDPIMVEDGLDRLQWKLGKTRDEIQAALQEE